MRNEIPYLFCRYDFIRKGKALDESEQQQLLTDLKGARIAYRNRDATEDEFDTFEMTPRHFNFDDVGALSWCVGYDVRTRDMADYDATNDEIDEYTVETEGIKYTRFVAVPSLGALAVSDQHGDTHLGAAPGISRFKAVVRSIKGNRIRIELAGTTADLAKAFKSWDVEQFSFSVRPFNPTRRRLGGRLHDLMVQNGVAQLNGVARPTDGRSIKGPDVGIVGEAIGLADEGYGQIALKGVTKEGRNAAIGKPHFSQEKSENKKRQANPRTIKVYINDPGTSERARVREIVEALEEFYGRKK